MLRALSSTHRMAAVAAFSAVACRPGPAEFTRPVLRISGSDTIIEELIPQLVESHKHTVGTLDFELTPRDTAASIRQLLDR